VAITAIAITFAAGSAMAQQLSPQDKTFATKAAAGGQAEVMMGQLAEKNGSSQQVKQFGQRMVQDHTQANQELMVIARSQNLTLPTTPDAKDRSTEERLSNMKGQAFDTAYIQDMVQDHQEDIADFQKEAQNGQDPALKAFAQKYLPVLQQHLQMAKAAQSSG
jgi:putative membrane protein